MAGANDALHRTGMATHSQNVCLLRFDILALHLYDCGSVLRAELTVFDVQ